MSDRLTWSTRQVAALAGTTQKAVRYYHSVGLLAEPERGVNGYKHYGVAHLRRLIHIVSLAELGLPLARIKEIDDVDADTLIDELDATLEAKIRRLEANRARLALLRTHGVGWEVPAELADVLAGLADADRSVLAVASRVLDDQSVAQLRDLLARHEPTDTDEELTQLPDDATPEQIEDLARRIVAQVQGAGEQFPGVSGAARVAVPRRLAHEAVAAAMVESFRAAQLRVLVRVSELAAAAPGEIPAP